MTGIIISVVVHLVKNASGVRGAAHLVETNIMLGRPEGPISAPYQRKPHNLSMSTLIPIDENFSQSFMKGKVIEFFLFQLSDSRFLLLLNLFSMDLSTVDEYLSVMPSIRSLF